MNRFTQTEIYKPDLNNFKLNYDQLKEPIIAKQNEYNAFQTGLDDYYQKLMSTAVDEKDIPTLQAKVDNLIAEEKALRDTVKGDLTNPRYQEEIKNRLRAESNDIFYKNAAWNKTQFQKDADARAAYRAKYGEDPAAWQDGTTEFKDNFINSAESGTYTSTGIIERLPFTPKAMEYLKPAITKKLEKEGYSFDEDPVTGRRVMVSATGQRMTKKELRTILEGNNEIMDGVEIDQMRKDYEDKVNKGIIDPNEFPTFDSYLDDTIESIVSNLAYQWSSSKITGIIDPLKVDDIGNSKVSRSARTASEAYAGSSKITTGPSQTLNAAASPIGYPTMMTSTSEQKYLELREKELMTTTANSIFERLTVANQGYRVQDFKPVYGVDSTGVVNAQLNLSYQTDSGEVITVDLSSPEALARRQELAAIFGAEYVNQALADADKWDAEMNKVTSKRYLLEDFDNQALAEAFTNNTDPNLVQRIKDKGFYLGMLTEEQRKEAFSSEFKNAASILRSGKPLVYTLPKMVNGMVMGEEEVSAPLSDEIYTTIARALGLPENFTGAIGTDEKKARNFAIQEAMKGKTSQQIEGIIGELREQAATEYLTEKNNPRFNEYVKYYTDKWEKGLTEQLTPKPGKGAKSGIRTVPKVVYHLNVNSSTGSQSAEEYNKNLNQMLSAAITSHKPGDGDQRGTYSEMTVFDFKTDEAVPMDKVEDIGKDYRVVGFTYDSTGYSIVIQSDGDGNPDSVGGSMYEIRNQDQIITFLEQAGFANKTILQTANDISLQLQDTFPSTEGSQRKGQTRGKISEVVQHSGGFNAVISRAQTDMMWKDPFSLNRKDLGRPVKEGEFIYYSKTKAEWVITADVMKVAEEYTIDRHTQYVLPNESTSFQANSFGDNVEVNPDLFAKGTNIMTRPLYNLIGGLAQQANAPKMRINSALRTRTHAESKANPKSMHLQGDAVDIRILENGKVREEVVSFLNDNLKDNENFGFLIEFPSTSHPEYDYYKKKYGNKVVANGNDVHLHIQYNRQY